MAGLKAFLCHSSSDKPTVRSLYTRLRSDGIEPWFDEADLLPGQDWEFEIRKAIRACHVVLVCLSQDSVNRVGYLQKEIRNVLDVADEQPEGVIFVIPARLESCQVPDRLRRWQWVDLFEENGYERLMRALDARTESLSSQRSGGATEPDVPAGLPPTASSLRVDKMVKESSLGAAAEMRFGGLYLNEGTDYHRYLRFYPSGVVLSASTTANSTPLQVAEWFTPTHEWSSKGDYKVQGKSISFPTHSSYGVVDYNGTLEKDGSELHLHTHSHINGNESFGVWRFIPLS